MQSNTKCSRCKKMQIEDNFGYKRSGDSYKTCQGCRKYKPGPIATAVPISDNIETPDAARPGGCYKVCTTIKETFESYNYINQKATFADLLRMEDCEYDLSKRADFMQFATGKKTVKKYDLGIDEDLNCVDTYMFCPEQNTFYNIIIRNVELINNFIRGVTFSTYYKCEICCITNTKLNECCRCHKIICLHCFDKLSKEKYYSCPFCRFNLAECIKMNMKALSLPERDVFVTKYETISS